MFRIQRDTRLGGATERDALAADFLDRCVEAWRPLAPAMKLLARAVGLPW